jgi:hypothetical protein
VGKTYHYQKCPKMIGADVARKRGGRAVITPALAAKPDTTKSVLCETGRHTLASRMISLGNIADWRRGLRPPLVGVRQPARNPRRALRRWGDRSRTDPHP